MSVSLRAGAGTTGRIERPTAREGRPRLVPAQRGGYAGVDDRSERRATGSRDPRTARVDLVWFVPGVAALRGTWSEHGARNGDVELLLKVPLLVRQRALANGVAGQRWLDGLDEVVAALAERWALDLVEALSGGTASYVVAAIDRSGRPCVLKVGMPLDSDEADAFGRSVRSLQLADGRGCARLLYHDASVPALLLERLGSNLHEMSMPVPDIVEAICATLLNFWRPVSAGVDLPSGAEKALWLARYIDKMWTALDRPCPKAVIYRARTLCDERAAAFDPSRALLVHGDAHGWNTLDAGGGSFKFIDPEGLLSEPEHDLSVAMREYNGPLLSGDTPRLVRQRAEFLAARCEADAQAVWEWGFIERVSTGLAAIQNFGGDAGRAFLEVAARCL